MFTVNMAFHAEGQICLHVSRSLGSGRCLPVTQHSMLKVIGVYM